MNDRPDFLHRQLQTMAPHRALVRSMESRLMSEVELISPVLDVGCGDGHFASTTFTRPIDVGLDPSQAALLEAQKYGPGVYRSLVQADSGIMPFGDASFSTIISNSVIEHIPDVDRALREMSRVLRPGGVFFATFPSEHFLEFLFGTTLARRVGAHGASRGYSNFHKRISACQHIDPPAVWRTRFEAVGWTVVEQQYYFSAAAHRTFDLAHYVSVPNLLAKKLTGKWVVHPYQAKPFEWWYRRYYNEPPPVAGAYQYVLCVKEI